jgi:tetratricopeptide (TPR) repeat protein
MALIADHKDRISGYLIKLNEGALFDELSDDYLQKAGLYDVLRGVPVPLDAGVGDELTTLTIGLGMARIIGADTEFRYKDQYLEYMHRVFGDQTMKILLSEGVKAAGKGDYEVACMFFRAALLIDPKSCDALYLYGRACSDAYSIETEDEEYIGNFKAESLDVFEVLTMLHPDFAMGYYFLGYGYANLGLYTKAKLTWDTFMELTAAPQDDDTAELREEIKDRLDQLHDPVRIEKGQNCVLSGDFVQGIEILSQYTEGAYSKWWPLWYYLGVAYTAMGDAEKAIESYREALAYSPSNTDVMDELAEVYEAVGDWDNAMKYRRKIEVVKENIAAEEKLQREQEEKRQ